MWTFSTKHPVPQNHARQHEEKDEYGARKMQDDRRRGASPKVLTLHSESESEHFYYPEGNCFVTIAPYRSQFPIVGDH